MRQYYCHKKTKKNHYFFYMNWVNHDGFGRPRMKINKKVGSATHVFDFSCYKLHCYLVRSKVENWNGDKPIKVNWK